jgi:hypothetical protein
MRVLERRGKIKRQFFIGRGQKAGGSKGASCEVRLSSQHGASYGDSLKYVTLEVILNGRELNIFMTQCAPLLLSQMMNNDERCL